ncbi:hypothetical protein [Cupriavidus alkaliphilus]|uniref:hypothetical protein n=1 Tax=Cupriavidus alkaliphilus TaxID=942866 RepID=UPI0008156122|nr:hypothetical protein [Cupriavidus alkaliphilus]SCB10113.1 hypothetical protein GA0116996_101617 [Cupriavidus alkaliphilus]
MRTLAEVESLLAVARETNVALASRVAQLERLARELKNAAAKHPHQPLSRWVKFGPMAAFLATIKDQA